MPGPVRNPTEAYQQMEAIMLRQMLQSSGAFKASSTPGAQLRTDMFIETLADAVAKAGGLGIAHMLEQQLGGAKAASSPSAASSPPMGSQPSWAIASRLGGAPGSMSGLGGMGSIGSTNATSTPPSGAPGAIDDLDDPNSEAPLPEDPSAASIDDYQAQIPTHPRAPLHLQPHPDDSLKAGRSGFSAGPIARALNRYRERVEANGEGSSTTPVGGDKQ